MKRTLRTNTLLAFLVLALPMLAAPGKKDKKGPEEKKKTEGIKDLGEVTKKCTAHDGLFTLYQDTTNGELYILVKKSQLDQDFLHFSQVADGVVDAGAFRGGYGDSRIFRFQRYFDRLEVRLRNTRYQFDPENPLSRASGANINEPVVVAEKIAAANKAQDSLLVRAESLFMDEGFEQLKWPAPKGAEDWWFDLGKLDKERSKVLGIRNYPMNTDVVSEYVWTNSYPKNRGSEAVTDPRSVAIRMHHSLIQLPDDGFTPRQDDPRVGYFMTQKEDMTTTETIPWRDVIHRWDLRKKDPSAAISEPVEPIVWWIENTTPVELRPTIREGAEAWNIAFEQAGFRNAIVVKEQPDTATWDAGDIRYNVLRWTSSPDPPFGGYGPSFVDPRTGEILGADVMLEYIFITNRMREMELFQTAGLGHLAMDEAELERSREQCLFASDLQLQLLYGREVLQALSLGEAQEERFMQEALRDLVLHEVGHTLGLNHNMKASSIHTPDELRDRALTERTGLTGSVMDYSPANLPWEEGDEVQYFHSTPGPYDVWAIRYGYTEVAGGGEAEAVMLEAILDESTRPEHRFGNDADDMRSPGRGIDPRVNIFDMSADPVEHGLRTIATCEKALGTVKERYGTGDRSYQELLRSYLVLTGRMIGACNVMTRQIGGIYEDRSFADQDSEVPPFVPVPKETQEKAMKALAEHAFAPDAFRVGTSLYPYLQRQRRGYDHWAYNDDPYLHDRVIGAQRMMLVHLLHPNTLRRLVDAAEYGNTYTLAEMMTDLTDAIFAADRAGSVNTYRQNLQQAYVDMLADVASGKRGHREHAQSMAVYELDRVRKGLNLSAGDTGTKAHRTALKLKIDRALSTEG